MPFDRRIFDNIEADIAALTTDEIKTRLEPLMIGFHIVCPIFDPGAFIYRARQLGPKFCKDIGITREDLIYPPANKAAIGRLNRAGTSVFYGSMHKEAMFFELPGLKAGDELIVAFWKTKRRMLVNNIGYTEYAFEQLGARRPVPDWSPKERPGDSNQTLSLASIPKETAEVLMSNDDAHALKEALSKYFTRQIGPGEADYYKLTGAIGELHLGDISDQGTKFAGVLYPSVRMFANGDNIALQTWFVDAHLEFRKAVHVRIKERRDTQFNIDYLDSAYGFDDNGRLKWLGRLKNWTIQPGQAVRAIFEAGVDADGDYYTSKGGQPAHWVITDTKTGVIIEAS